MLEEIREEKKYVDTMTKNMIKIKSEIEQIIKNGNLDNYIKRNEFNQFIQHQMEEENQRKQQMMLLTKKEMNKIEEWTQKKCTEVIFDSNTDDWNMKTSVFDDKVKNRSNLIFLVETTNGNKFGYYFTGTIKNANKRYKSPNCFLFSLKSNGGINEMMKFEEKQTAEGFFLYDKSNPKLFSMNYGFIMNKRNERSSSYVVYQDSSRFDFHGTRNAMCANSSNDYQDFTTTRFVVIQMN